MKPKYNEKLKEIISVAKDLMDKEVYIMDEDKVLVALSHLRDIGIKEPSTVDLFKDCPFWTGVEYFGQYECARYNNICHGCNYNSKHWYRRLWFKVSVEIEIWYYCWFLYQVNKLKAYLFNRKEYEIVYAPRRSKNGNTKK